MSDQLSRRILQHIADARYRPMRPSALARELGVPEEVVPEFKKIVDELVEDGQVVMSSDQVSLPPMGREMTGVIRVHPKGFAFIIPDTPTAHGDLFVPEGRTLGSVSGDRVRAKVQTDRGRAGGGRSPYTGRVVEITKRVDRHYVGTLKKRGSLWLVVVDGQFLSDPVIIRDPHAKNAKLDDKVVIEIIEYPTDDELGEGVIVEVLGESGEPSVETQGIIRAFGLPGEFPEAVVDEARAASQSLDADNIPDNREDLTDKFILTIDPPDAKDFDDAINIDRLEDQPDGAVYELGVHIADVAFFVTPGSALDEEAYLRGNSCYLPRLVVPMLPEVLSNGVCSLQEAVTRYTKSAFIRLDANGKVVGQRLARTAIRSVKRLTYLEAQALIDDDIKEARKHTKGEPKYSRELIEKLKLMDELAKIIRKRRFKAGMIVLGLPEVNLIFDDNGRVADAEPEDDAYTHRIIEMFMVEANEAAARLFSNLDVPMIRRIHPDPPTHDTNQLRQFARVAGFNIPNNPSRKELQTLLESVEGKPAQKAVHFAVLRTLSKAEYAPLLIGHFALASEHYTHFTSPIRRYPDLIVHRGIDAYLDALGDHTGKKKAGGKSKGRVGKDVLNDPRVPNEERLNEICRQCSGTERAAEAAERELRNYLVLELLAEHLGDDYSGTVTGVTGSGLFIQLDKFLVDGFVKVADLSGTIGSKQDRWRLNRATGTLVAERSGKSIGIGHTFTVRIASVDLPRRKLELAIIADTQPKPTRKLAQGGDAAKSAKPKSTKHRKGSSAKKANQKSIRKKKQRKRR